jgi:glycosyl transferase family 1
MIDVLIVSLGGTAGLREADAELAGSLRRAGASVELVAARRPREWRTMAAIELAWAVNARRAAREAIAAHAPRAVLYSSTTAALLGPTRGAIRFDAPAAGNRPGRHGIWQRRVERGRFEDAPLLVPWSEGGLAEAPKPHADAVVVPVPVEPSGIGIPPTPRDIAAITYGANPEKKGLDRVLTAWRRDRRADETLIVAGLAGAGEAGVKYAGMLSRAEYRALLRRARVFLTAPRREDYGIAQLEALADGCMLVTTPSPGPYAALPIAHALDPRLVSSRLDVRAALDEPSEGYAERAATALAAFSPAEVDRVVARDLLPLLKTIVSG